eukprot:jgi/Orpsp1_1/1183159/evm.model.c7180000084140.1
MDFSDNCYNAETVHINNFIFYSMLKSKLNGINFHGNVYISNSSFYGNSSVEGSVIHYDGEGSNSEIIIDNSYFDGAYSNICLSHVNTFTVNIESSKFERGYAYKTGGGAIQSKNSVLSIRDCEFKDNFSYHDGGVILEGYSQLYMENIYGKNINMKNCVGLFTLDSISNIELRNIEFRDVKGSNSNGILFNSNNEDIGSSFYLYNGTFIDFQYTSEVLSSFIQSSKYVNIVLEDLKIEDFNGLNSNLVYQGSSCNVEIHNSYISNFNSIYSVPLFKSESITDSDKNELLLDKFELYGFYSSKSIIQFDYGEITIKNSIFNDIMSCAYNLDCKYTYENVWDLYDPLFDIGEETKLLIEKSDFEYIYMNSGFQAKANSTITINESNFRYGSFYHSFIPIDTNKETGKGFFEINDSYFFSMDSNYGGILYIEEIDSSSNIVFNNCIFELINSYQYGGIVYSKSINSNLYIFFKECEFIDCHSQQGKISYSYTIASEPYFSNIDELRKIEGAFYTNPSNIQFTSDSAQSASIYSGDSLDSNIKVQLFDDYGNLCRIYSYNYFLEQSIFETFTFFSLEVDDPYNINIIGAAISYCWEDECKAPNVKVIGNPGNYKLKLKFITYGFFKEFDNNTLDFDITIKDCPSTHVNQALGDNNFKSCYLPVCDPSCNGGKCMNNNLCDCKNATFTGPYCNEYYKLGRLRFIDYPIRVISIILFILVLLIMSGIVLFRNNQLIKGASIDFSFIILFGMLFNCLYIYFLTLSEKTRKNCTFLYYFKSTGFSMVFGSILVKTYRIYKICHHYCFCSLHYTILLDISNAIDSDVEYTSDFKEYTVCSYPISKKL